LVEYDTAISTLEDRLDELDGSDTDESDTKPIIDKKTLKPIKTTAQKRNPRVLSQ
jgi:hypothetical protein